MKRLLLAVSILLGGCVVVPARSYPRPPPSPAAPPELPAPAPSVPAPPTVVRAKEIRAETIRARIIYAKQVKSAGGRVGRVIEGNSKEWERGRTDEEVRAGLIEADVIYAKDIRADWIEAAEVHAKDVRIGR